MNILKNDRGYTLVFIGLFLFLLLLFLGVSVDAGWTIYVRSQGQARVDAAALAAASALTSTISSSRQTEATARADTFSDRNSVVNTSTDPPNTVNPMWYNFSTHTLTTAADWSVANCNAVQVAEAVPTPLFFSGIRNFFGASETGSMNINVDATAYLGCLGEGKPELPVAFCADAIDFVYPDSCNGTIAKQVPSPTDNSAFFAVPPDTAGGSSCTSYVNGGSPQVGVGDPINLNNGAIASCLMAIEDAFNQNQVDGKWCVLVPIFTGDCTNNFNGQRDVAGFANYCITEVVATGSEKNACGEPPDNHCIIGQLECVTEQGPSGGQCKGVQASNPILVE